MIATLLAILVALMLVAVFVVACLAMAAKSRMPVKFQNIDEQDSVYSVARWTAKQLDIKAGDQRLRYSLLLWLYSGSFSWLGSIPVEELVLPSPFIDLMIDGKGQP